MFPVCGDRGARLNVSRVKGKKVRDFPNWVTATAMDSSLTLEVGTSRSGMDVAAEGNTGEHLCAGCESTSERNLALCVCA